MTIISSLQLHSINVIEKYQPGVDDGESNKVDITGAKMVIIKAVGAGGSGGGGGGTDDAGTGGGGGGYAEVYLTTTHISSYTHLVVTLGTGGSSKSDTNNGDAGGNTTVHFDSSPDVLIVTCNGGNGGIQGNLFGGYGATGGSATISIGEGFVIQGFPGQNGHDGTLVPYFGGGYGGDSQLGPGGLGAAHETGSTVNDAMPGIRGGGGGGGADYTDGLSGAGGNGCVIITIFK